MEPCSTAGLSPCSDCCGKSGVGAGNVSGGGSGAAGIAGVPQDSLTGEMIALEFGQDYDERPEEYEAAAGFIRMMGSPEDRARAARSWSVGIAERDFEKQVMHDVDLIEGEVAQPEDMEAIEVMVFTKADGAIRRAYRDQIAETLSDRAEGMGIYEQLDHLDRKSLSDAMADRLEESGCVPWLSPKVRETLSYGMETPGLRLAFDDACDTLAFRRGVLPESMPVASMMTDLGSDGMANGQNAPEGSISLVEDTGVQDFPLIRAVNGHLVPTEYGDGFDVGDVVTYDAGWSMTLPHFAFVVRRTPKMIETIDLPTVNTSSDMYGQTGSKRPVPAIDLSGDWPRKKSRMRKGGSFSIDGHWTHPWDGGSQYFDYMD